MGGDQPLLPEAMAPAAREVGPRAALQPPLRAVAQAVRTGACPARVAAPPVPAFRRALFLQVRPRPGISLLASVRPFPPAPAGPTVPARSRMADRAAVRRVALLPVAAAHRPLREHHVRPRSASWSPAIVQEAPPTLWRGPLPSQSARASAPAVAATTARPLQAAACCAQARRPWPGNARSPRGAARHAPPRWSATCALSRPQAVRHPDSRRPPPAARPPLVAVSVRSPRRDGRSPHVLLT